MENLNITIGDHTDPYGEVEIIEFYNDGRPTTSRTMKNAVVKTGRQALAKALANQIGNSFEFYIARMLFGNGGTQNGIPRNITEDRTGLFGLTVASKGVISTIDPTITSLVTFTSVLGFNEANNTAINEMALQMANGDIYSMRTFADLNKTPQMQIVFNWKISFI